MNVGILFEITDDFSLVQCRLDLKHSDERLSTTMKLVNCSEPDPSLIAQNAD